MKETNNLQQYAQYITEQIQTKTFQAVNLAKWKIDQQNQLLKLGNEIRALEDEIEARKTLLADGLLAQHGQGKFVENEILEICKQIERLNSAKVARDNEKSNIQMESPPVKVNNRGFLAAGFTGLTLLIVVCIFIFMCILVFFLIRGMQ